jgi:hypothetical protein
MVSDELLSMCSVLSFITLSVWSWSLSTEPSHCLVALAGGTAVGIHNDGILSWTFAFMRCLSG